MFDPNKHRKTTERLATLQNTSQLVWKIDKLMICTWSIVLINATEAVKRSFG
jgi:hypothetical protein